MKRTCDLFDRYRDGELDSSEKGRFECHMNDCQDCRLKMSLLNNVAYALKYGDVPVPGDLAQQIAQRAFRQESAWDALVVSWLRPIPLLATLALTIILASLLRLVPDYRIVNNYSEYEALMSEADALNLKASNLPVQNDNEFEVWLVQEGNSQ